MSNVFLKVLLEFSELNNSNGGAIRQVSKSRGQRERRKRGNQNEI